MTIGTLLLLALVAWIIWAFYRVFDIIAAHIERRRMDAVHASTIRARNERHR